MYTPIKDYAAIGNLKTVALVSRRGSIDWLPAPTLDAGTLFASILDTAKGGHWRVELADSAADIEQSYVPNTNIVTTTFTSEAGTLRVSDFMTVRSDTEDNTDNTVVRKLECIAGVCDVQVQFQPAPEYGQVQPVYEMEENHIGVRHEGHEVALYGLHNPEVKDGSVYSQLSLQAGQSVALVLSLTGTLLGDVGEYAETAYADTAAYWQGWAHTCDGVTCPVAGPWHEASVRSALAMKLLFTAPHHTMAAAATTSLPEELGGVRNWDYRFNWVRDTSFALQVMMQLGHTAEARSYWQWFSRSCAPSFVDDPRNMQCIYGLQGQHDLPELTLEHFEGYEGSAPVRVGNGAARQRQWDNFGTLLDFVWTLHQRHPFTTEDFETWQIVKSVADFVTQIWQTPDEGIWEVRDGGHSFVYSKVMCWVALDRASKLAQVLGFDADAQRWNEEKQKVKDEVFEKGWSEEKQSFTQSYETRSLDASTLRMSAVGFIDGDDPRMKTTIDRIEQELSVGSGLLLRYKSEDGLPGHEGAFLITSFWLIDALVLAGELDRAKQYLNTLHQYVNHVGLYAEEIEPKSGAFLGNFPQAYSHTGLLGSVMNVVAPAAVPAQATEEIVTETV